MIAQSVAPFAETQHSHQHEAHQINAVSTTNDRPFACLYTKHKTQKHKIWRDGRLVVNNYSCWLYNADPHPGSGDPIIDTCSLERDEVQAIFAGHRTEMESEKFLITINGPWTKPSLDISHFPKPTYSTASSKGMSKLLKTKFREPKRTGPPPPPSSLQHDFLAKRQRPLQPGELQNRYYGPQTNQIESAPMQPRPPPPRQTTRHCEFISNQSFNASSFYEEDENDGTSTHPSAPFVNECSASTFTSRSSRSRNPELSFQNPPNGHEKAAAKDRYSQPKPYLPIKDQQHSRRTFDQPQSQVDVSWFGQPLSTQNTPPVQQTTVPVPDVSKRPPSRRKDTNNLPVDAFASSNNFRPSQYYDEEEEEEEVVHGAPEAFIVTASDNLAHDKATRSELLDIFSVDTPSAQESSTTTDDFVLPDINNNSSSEEEC